MQLTYTPDSEMMNKVIAIAEKKGEIKAYFLNELNPNSRESLKEKSIYATLALEDRTLEEETVRAILDGRPILTSHNRTRQIKNTRKIYDQLNTYNPYSQDSFRKANLDLIAGLHESTGYRTGIQFNLQWTGFAKQTTDADEMVKGMKELFNYLQHSEDPMLIKSCLCHYAIQYHCPFEYENEIMSRLWQRLLLFKDQPLFEIIPWEKEVLSRWKEYYFSFPRQDWDPDPTSFINLMLEIIHNALVSILISCRRSVKPYDRIQYFYIKNQNRFSRKDYMLVHKNISAATASRDLDLGVELGFFSVHGQRAKTTYSCRKLLE